MKIIKTMLFNGETLKFDRTAECDWCGKKKLVGVTHYGTRDCYNRLICEDCANTVIARDNITGVQEEYKKYYIYLEHLRQSGVTNMFGIAPYLMEEFGLTKQAAIEIVSNWIECYEDIAEEYYCDGNDDEDWED